jgi:hypothetical protein
VRGQLGAPGVIFLPDVPPATLLVEPMDVAAFVGVAPRGPAWEPVDDPTLHDLGVVRARSVAVAVSSWDDYVERFGAFEAPSLLPHAVAAYFAEGGRLAYVVRIVHDEPGVEQGIAAPPGCAQFSLTTPSGAVVLRSRNEGSWGNNLRITLSFATRPVAVLSSGPGADLVLDPGSHVPAGALVRVRGVTEAPVLRWVTGTERRGRPTSTGYDLVATLDSPPGFVVAVAEQIEAELEVVDPGRASDESQAGDRAATSARVRSERLTALGLSVAHPRWMAGIVRRGSRLVDVVDAPSLVAPDVVLSPVAAVLGSEGADRGQLVTPADVFGRILLGDEAGTQGIDALLGAPEVASVVVPDLYSPVDLGPAEPVEEPGISAGPVFRPCLVRPSRLHPPPKPPALSGLHLDPADPGDLEAIIALQQQLVEVAEQLRCVALLDVPPGLRQGAILQWRARFDSSFAAAYHPWARVPAGDPASPLIALNPSSIAAGIIARCERREGVPRGPANELATGVVDLSDRVDDARHTELHLAGVDVLRREPDGIWLAGARTLSTEREWRQLSVRRLLLLIERAVGRQLKWTVFEPNDDALRAGLRQMLDHLLGQLFAQGAFAGATPAASWFVRVAVGHDVVLESDQGQVVVEVGVAPSEPTEYIVVRVSLDAEGAVETSLRTGSGVLARG